MKKISLISIVTILLSGLLFWVFPPGTDQVETGNTPVNYTHQEDQPGNLRESYEGTAKYLHELKANPYTGLVTSADLKAAMIQAGDNPRNKKGYNLIWENLGPDNIGGRTRAIVVDNNNPNIVYAGGVSGGFWKSTSGGAYWKQKTYPGQFTNLCIVSMTQDAGGDIYFGTGEQHFVSSAQGTGSMGNIGMGVWKSTDKGENWEHLEATIPSTPFSSFSPWENVNDLASDPGVAGRIYAATSRGVRYSTDKGETWSLSNGDRIKNATVLDLKASNDGKTLFAATRSKVFRSTDQGESFKQISGTGGLPVLSANRTELAIASSDPDYVYAAFSSASGTLHSVYRSKDNGDTWEKIGTGSSTFEPFRGQGNYDMVIAADPLNPEKIYLGGVTFWMYHNGTWLKAANAARISGNDYNPYYLHPDQHVITFTTQTTPPAMYIGNDGGLFKSTDFHIKKFPTFKSINNGYNVTQYYALAVSKTGDVIGGTQDNNTLRIEKDGFTGKSATRLLGGDGFHASISRLDPRIFFMESQYGNLVRSRGRGSNPSPFFDEHVTANFPFNTPFRIWETRNDPYSPDSILFTASQNYHKNDTLEIRSLNNITFKYVLQQSLDSGKIIKVQDPTRSFFALAGSGRIFLTDDALNFSKTPVWFNIANIFMSSPRTIEFAPDGNTFFVGGGGFSSGGKLFRISGLRKAKLKYDKNGNFDPSAAGIQVEQIAGFGSQVVTGIGVDPNDGNRMVVTLGNYGPNFDHVYFTNNALDSPASNVSFQVLDNKGQSSDQFLPTMPVYDGMISMDDPNLIMVATELGMWAFDLSNPAGGWSEENMGMNKVPTHMIRQIKVKPWHDAPKVYIATHGRGIFMTSSLGTNLGFKDDDHKSENETSTHQQALKLYPNPARSYINLEFRLSQPSPVDLNVYNFRGQKVKYRHFQNRPEGKNTLKLQANELPSGNYIFEVKGNHFRETGKVIIQGF